MANLFDAGNVPTTEPATIVAGDLLQWKRTDLGTDYANGSYTLSYKARLEGTNMSIPEAADNMDYARMMAEVEGGYFQNGDFVAAGTSTIEEVDDTPE